MSRYVDADKLYEMAITHKDFKQSIADFVSLKEVLDDTPTADVAEVIHSEWHTVTVRMSCIDVTCRNCHNTEKISVTNYFEYCPHCGAKMDGERKESNDN